MYDREDHPDNPWAFSIDAEFAEARIGSNVGYVSARITGEVDEDRNIEARTLVVEVLEVELGVDQLFAVPLDDATRTAIEDAIREWFECDPWQVDEVLREGMSGNVCGSLTVRLPGQVKAA